MAFEVFDFDDEVVDSSELFQSSHISGCFAKSNYPYGERYRASEVEFVGYCQFRLSGVANGRWWPPLSHVDWEFLRNE